LYNPSHAACKKLLALIEAKEVHLSSLFLSSDEIGKELAITVSFNTNTKSSISVNLLNIYLAKYDINGTYIGKEELTNQLTMCPIFTVSDSKRFREVGTNIDMSCNVNLSSMVNSTSPYLYEAFIYINGEYLPIPIKILNYKDATGIEVNTDSITTNDVYVKRFAIVDFQSGVPSDTTKDSIYRWPILISFNVKLKAKEKIYMPSISIQYDEIYSKSSVCNPLVTQSQFISSYSMDISSFKRIAAIFMIVLHIVVALLFTLRIYLWLRSNAHKELSKSSGRFVSRVIYLLLDSWSIIFFWYLYAITFYWFIFFKLENRVYVLLPEKIYSLALKHMDTIFGLILVAKLITVVIKIAYNSSIGIFFLDYDLKNDDGEVDSTQISAWRTFFLANEFIENTNERHISIELTIFIFLFFYNGMGWEYMSSEQPFLEKIESNCPENPYLKYFILCSLFIAIGMIQWVLKLIMSIWIPISLQNFVDLCSIANTSVLVLDEETHGYYINGESPYGKADVSARTLYSYLEKGVVTGKDELVTYEFYMDYNIRKKIDELYAKQEYLNGGKKEGRYQSLEESKLELSSLLFTSIKVGQSKPKTTLDRLIGLQYPKVEGNAFFNGTMLNRSKDFIAEGDTDWA
jgi:meckelin